jgi:hypothetical protein
VGFQCTFDNYKSNIDSEMPKKYSIVLLSCVFLLGEATKEYNIFSIPAKSSHSSQKKKKNSDG